MLSDIVYSVAMSGIPGMGISSSNCAFIFISPAIHDCNLQPLIYKKTIYLRSITYMLDNTYINSYLLTNFSLLSSFILYSPF